MAMYIVEIFLREKDTQGINTRYRHLQRFIEAGADLQERIPLLVNISRYELGVGKVGWGAGYSPCVVLDLDLAFLVSAYSERARKKGSPLSTDEIVYQSPGNASEDTSSRIALISTHGDSIIHMTHHQWSSNEATKQLVAFLTRFLYGDDSGNLVQKVDHQMGRIAKGINDESIEYERVVDRSLEEFLAEKKLGYRFLDKNTGAVISSYFLWTHFYQDVSLSKSGGLTNTCRWALVQSRPEQHQKGAHAIEPTEEYPYLPTAVIQRM
ncbi:hypothetical protein F5Y00DRAFT_192616 [Daldinia vernicosa]|uniref:uncharacterized protein n=1 Tax=Daldinia vernicosa TaxID=114800 RepID=UPI002007F76D|nr:uncharacterized protein F5Y00DRAFT_192616 [Daldinia vernicosa]KAI0852277.1 hypothetical protein F5Y00DRAFT_192616 [Daldinia vernicosa]